MLSQEKLERLISILGDLTGEQKVIVREALNGPINARELFEKLDGVDEGKFVQFLKAAAMEKESAVLGQELSLEEMASAGGGHSIWDVNDWSKLGCAATVEDGSSCFSNDGCKGVYYVYTNIGQRCPADPRMPHSFGNERRVNFQTQETYKKCTRCNQWIQD